MAERSIPSRPHLPKINWDELATFADSEGSGPRSIVSPVEFQETSFSEAWLDSGTLVRSGEAEGYYRSGREVGLPYVAIFRFSEPTE